MRATSPKSSGSVWIKHLLDRQFLIGICYEHAADLRAEKGLARNSIPQVEIQYKNI